MAPTNQVSNSYQLSDHIMLLLIIIFLQHSE